MNSIFLMFIPIFIFIFTNFFIIKFGINLTFFFFSKKKDYVTKFATEEAAENGKESESESELSSIEPFSDDDAAGMDL